MSETVALATAEVLPAVQPAEARPQNRSVAFRFLTQPGGWIPLLLVLAILVLAFGAPLWGLQDPMHIDPRVADQAPSADHWLGTDSTGRDLWSRLVWGGQDAFRGAAIVLVVALILGVPTGLIAGYHGGLADGLLGWVSDVLMSLPSIIILLIVAGLTHQNADVLMAAMGVFMAPGYFRLTRSSTIAVRAEPYIDAARVAGISHTRIVFVHIWRVIAAPIVIQTAMTIGVALGMQAGLQILGVGDSQAPSWGGMMSSAMGSLRTNAWLIVPPAAMLGLVIAAFAIMGARLGEITGNRSEKAKHLTRAEKAELAGAAAARAAEATQPNQDLMVAVKGLKVTYATAKARVEVVHGVDLAVRKGEVLGLVGESGSGKSQSIFALLGLLAGNGYAEAEAIWVDGQNVLTLPAAKRRALLGRTIGYVPQEPISNLDPMYTIGHQLVEPMRKVLGMGKAEARAYALELLARVGIEDPARVMGLHPHEVSGGMAQRVLIAGAVAGHPKVIVADEPTTALDVTVQAEVLELLRELQREQGMALVIVTHNFGVVADIADTVTVMKDGLVVESGAVGSIFAHAADPYTRELIEASSKTPSRAALDEGGVGAGAPAKGGV
ncbi:MAG: dipeptide/oligopeptide/nickel ABC transporter permease/ATP-binding protein [Bifidobacteriaceae bacterium]|nr:dipeptide/oligopeptide/nickel ABC transporter permease/ATP-binding protein [Bifidobacteriaceae bacterium]